MKYTINKSRVEEILNRGYIPPTGLTASEAEHGILVDSLRRMIASSAEKMGILDQDEVGDVYPSFQNDHLLRVELLSWRVLCDGLLPRLASFLQTNAPAHSIVLTFDFQDDAQRALECPFIVILADEILGDFEVCDLGDTQTLLGFPSR